MLRYCYSENQRRSIRNAFDVEKVRGWIETSKYVGEETLDANEVPITSIIAACLVDMGTRDALEFLEAFNDVQKRRLQCAIEPYIEEYGSRKECFFRGVYPLSPTMPFAETWNLMKGLYRPVINVSSGWRTRSRFHLAYHVFVDSESNFASGREGLSNRVLSKLDVETRQDNLEKEIERSAIMQARRSRIDVAMEHILTARDALNRAYNEAFRVLDRRVGHTSLIDSDNPYPLHSTLDVRFNRPLRVTASHEEILASLNACAGRLDFDLLHLVSPKTYHAVIHAQERIVSSFATFRTAHDFLVSEMKAIKHIVKTHQESYETMREKLLQETENRVAGQRYRKMKRDQHDVMMKRAREE